MGWNSWNINETIVRQTVDAIVATGLAAASYQYDDFCQSSRDDKGIIQSDPHTFPSDNPALVDYVHSKKLKLGYLSSYLKMMLYDSSDAGFKT